MSNHVILYSNGIADFRWTHSIDAQTVKPISISIRNQHLADVLSSLTVYGPVTVSAPPTYSPANPQKRLSFDTADVMASLAERLSGAKLEVTTPTNEFSGTLVGLQSEQRAAENRFYTIQLWLISTVDGVHRVPFPEIIRFRFTDAEIQHELELALQRNVDRIKPDSTTVELELTADQKTDATVQYTIPCAAWKISYRILAFDDEIGMQFMGHAIVDNNTDQDWNDFHVSVVTGQPITFSSDLDEIRVPYRQHVNLVSDRAHGAVEVAMAGGELAEMDTFGLVNSPAPEPAARMRSASHESPAVRKKKVAQFETAKVDEAGDFSIFHSPHPVTIDANSSAMIPTFSVSLDDSRRVLYFNPQQHPSRPYRAIQFLNACDFPLGRGACTVFEDHNYAGSCVLPATRPGNEALLVHAVDTGVKIEVEREPVQTRLYSVKVSRGVAVESKHRSWSVQYRIESSHDRPFRMLVDHPCSGGDKALSKVEWNRSGNTESLTFELVDNCFRIPFELSAREAVTLTVTEQSRDKHLVHLLAKGDRNPHNIDWLRNQFLKLDGERLNDPALQQVLAAHEQYVGKLDEIEDLNQQTVRLEKRQERLRKNLKVGAEDAQSIHWRKQLGESEEQWFDLENQMEQRQTESDQLAAQVRALLKDLVLEWSAE